MSYNAPVERRYLESTIRFVVTHALAHKKVALSMVHQLIAYDLLQSTTDFRQTKIFPGEYGILRYDFNEGERCSGFLGFDRHLTLISIDERYPINRQLYRRGTSENPEWVDVR